jgi:hypothetical protein
MGKNMLTMGFMISLSGLTSLGASNLVRIFIRSYGGIDQSDYTMLDSLS